MKKIVCILAIFAIQAAFAANEPTTFLRAPDFNARLQVNAPNQAMVAYLLGVHDAVSGVIVCTPDGVSGRDLLDAYQQFVDANGVPDTPAPQVIVQALMAKWPCGGSKFNPAAGSRGTL